jgi:anti-sigma B factor antagonist
METSASPRVSVPRQDRPSVLPIKGEIDLHVSPGITEVLTAMIKERPKRIVMDLSGATYIDSSGLAVLIVAMQEIEAYGGKFFLAGLNETVRSVLKSSRLDQTFRISDTVDAALAAD